MTVFAELNSKNVVVNLMVVADNLPNNGIDFVADVFGSNFVPVNQKNGARIGDTYDKKTKAFMPPQPFPSWVWNKTELEWEAPTSMPEPEDENAQIVWDEEKIDWVVLENE